MTARQNPDAMSFWEHLDVLRGILFKIALITLLFAAIAFAFKETLFNIILAPKNDDFIIYKFFRSISRIFSSDGNDGHFAVQLINTGLAKQFVIHMKAAIYAGFLVAAPYTLYQLFRFVSPALYTNERKYAVKVLGGGGIMFAFGVLLSYFLIFPLTFRFLGTYQVSEEVVNMISLESYMDTLMMLCVMMGIVFEIPILCWLFAKFGFLTAEFMQKYRKHAVVILLVVSAVITPTADIFTLTVVALPMWILYEASILIVRRTKAAQKAQEALEEEEERKADEAWRARQQAKERQTQESETVARDGEAENQPEDYNQTYHYYDDRTPDEKKTPAPPKRNKQQENLKRLKRSRKKKKRK